MSRPAPRLLLINPNTSAPITDALVAAACRHAAGCAIVGRTAGHGAPVISDGASFALGARAALDIWAAERGAAWDGIILGCFGDPGLAALRVQAPCPVVGLADACFAAMTGPFAVLTPGAGWPPILRAQIAALPCAPLCRGVLAVPASGAEIAADPDRFTPAIDGLALRAVAAGAETLILGGAVLAGFAPRLRPVARFTDCVATAMAAMLRALA